MLGELLRRAPLASMAITGALYAETLVNPGTAYAGGGCPEGIAMDLRPIDNTTRIPCPEEYLTHQVAKESGTLHAYQYVVSNYIDDAYKAGWINGILSTLIVGGGAAGALYKSRSRRKSTLSIPLSDL
jgi:hypothetical protein